MKTKSRPFRGTAFAYFENVFIPEFRCSEALRFRCLYAQNALRAHERGPLWRSRRSLPSRRSPLGSRRGRRAGRSS